MGDGFLTKMPIQEAEVEVLVREAFVSLRFGSGTGTFARSSLPGWVLRIRPFSSLS